MQVYRIIFLLRVKLETRQEQKNPSLESVLLSTPERWTKSIRLLATQGCHLKIFAVASWKN